MTDVDLLVAGAGAAGTAAALAAAESGGTVLCIDARATFRAGSNTAMSTSMVPATRTRFQDAAGIDDDPARFLADVMAKTHSTADPVVATTLVEVSADLVHWLVDHVGVPLGLVTDFNYPGHSALRCHSVPDRAGRTLHGHLLSAIDANSSIDLVTPLRLAAVDPRDGLVLVSLKRPDGSTEEVRAGAVVLATNGFGADADLVAAHTPEIAGALYHGGDGSTGDALSIGAALGADTSSLDAYQGHGSVAVPHGILVTWATVMHGGVMVDASGTRFGDETIGYSEFGAKVVSRPGGTAWLVYDERIHQACLPFADYQDLLQADAVTWSDDATALAGRIGCEPAALAATLDGAAAAAAGDRPDPHGRNHWTAPLVTPYAAVKVTGALFHTQGGLRIDAAAQVVRDGAPIPGVYAAGGAAVGMSGHGAGGYIAGNGLLAALGLGFIAGLSAGDRRTPGRVPDAPPAR